MKSLTLLSGIFTLSALTACGVSPDLTPSTTKSIPHHACTSNAYDKQNAARAEAQKAFDANAAACYELLDLGRTTSVSLCLKAAESNRKESLARADLALELDLASCQEVPNL
jgi:hypothetical protein